MNTTTPDELIPDKALLLIPHMDDELLGCGHLLDGLSNPEKVRLLFATIGNSLPAGIHPDQEKASPTSIAKVRKDESLEGLALFNIQPEQCHFLDLPDLSLKTHENLIYQEAAELLSVHSIDVLIAPFEFDQHPDHLALHRVAKRLLADQEELRLLEYFVYIHYPLLPGKDIRTYCHPSTLRVIQATSDKKRVALRCHISQTTTYFEGQIRPVLTDEFCDQASAGHEFYRDSARLKTTPSPLKRPAWIIQVIQTLQPKLKRIKETLRQKLSG